jgi:hypothetical protein
MKDSNDDWVHGRATVDFATETLIVVWAAKITSISDAGYQITVTVEDSFDNQYESVIIPKTLEHVEFEEDMAAMGAMCE